MIRIAVALASATWVQDWPGWRGPHRDGRMAEMPAPRRWPEKLQKGWTVEVGVGHATPALVRGKLFVFARQGEEETTLCLDAATGREIWRDKYPAPYEMDPTAAAHGKGPKSSPAVTGGRVFTFGISGILSCLEAETGNVVWRNDFKKGAAQYGTAMSPLLLEGACVVHIGGPGKGSIVALDPASGKTRWSWEGDGPGYASPVFSPVGPEIITQTQSFAVGLAPSDGKLLWQMEWKTSYEQNSVTPVLFRDLAILSGYHKGTQAFRLKSGEPAQCWQTTEVSMYMSTPVVVGDKLFGFSEKARGQFFALDAATGKTLWLGDGRQGDNAALVADGPDIAALTTKSQLVVFEADGGLYKEKARYTVAQTPTWAHPVIARDSVFVKDVSTLTRWH